MENPGNGVVQIVQVRAPVAEFQQRHDRKIDDRIKRRGRSFGIFGAVAMLFSR